MTCVSVLSTEHDSDAAIADVVARATADLSGHTADIALVFASVHHAEALNGLTRMLLDSKVARHVLGCTGESIAGEGSEVENRPALSLWALRHPGLEVAPRRYVSESDDVGPPSTDPSRVLVLLGDPYSFNTDLFLRQLAEKSRGLRVMGGMASAAGPGQNRLVLDGEVFETGAVALELDGSVALRTVVSQGCRPIGRPMIVTRVDRNLIRELGRRPALEVLREIYDELSSEEQELVQSGLHIGRVINEYQETFQRGDFLVRNVMGADESGGIAIGDLVRVGQTVQFHVRDARTADEDLRGLLESARGERGEAKLAGALLFSCNGRGTRLFPAANHDIELIREVYGPVPVAGFFAMGEIGPIGGQNFVHGFTASVLLFETAA